MRLHVLLVHWRRPEWCRAAVDSLLTSDSVEPLITIVDNSGDLGGVPPPLRVIRPGENLGFAGGANTALRGWLSDCEDEFCLVGAHDLLVEPQTLAGLVQKASAYPAFGVVGPALLSRGHTKQKAAGGPPEVVQYVPGVCMLIRRQCLLEVGLFDGDYGSYQEDRDFCLRAAEHGWKIGRNLEVGARQIGTASRSATRMKYANFVLLRAKRAGLYAGVKALASLPLFGARDLFLALLAHETARSLRNGRARLAALPSGALKLAAYGWRHFTRRGDHVAK